MTRPTPERRASDALRTCADDVQAEALVPPIAGAIRAAKRDAWMRGYRQGRGDVLAASARVAAAAILLGAGTVAVWLVMTLA